MSIQRAQSYGYVLMMRICLGHTTDRWITLMFRSLSILMISSDKEALSLVAALLESEGHSLSSVEDLQTAIATQRQDLPYDGILFDTSRQPPNSQYLLKDLHDVTAKDSLWLVSPMGINNWTRESERLGITQHLKKPLQRHDVEAMLTKITGHRTNFRTSPAPFQTSSPAPAILEELPGDRYFFACCPAMREIYDTVRLLAPVNIPVMILGESGVGKDIVASLLHKHSLRSQESYISVNCAALPADLLESELFGYDAGAFTGAIKSKPGTFDLADKGTILLDEIGEMSCPMQAKLLHVLQDGKFSRLGSRGTTQVDVRVIAATNVDMPAAIAEGRFREDLFYRLSAFTIEIPPLRERKMEIPFLVEEIMRKQAIKLRISSTVVPPGLLEAMQHYDWPGNLRELSNFVTRVLVTRDPEGAFAQLASKTKANSARNAPAAMQQNDEIDDTMPSVVRDLKGHTESRLIREALDRSGWNRRHAAMQLGISYRSLLYKIQNYQLADTRPPLRLHVH
jgi:two-component system, NtrC family, response regulator AtoC